MAGVVPWRFPSGRKTMDKDVEALQGIMLEKVKVTAMQILPRATARSLDVRVIEDFITRDLVLKLQSEVMVHKDGCDEQDVWVDWTPYPKALVLAVGDVLVGVGIALIILGYHLTGAMVLLLWSVGSSVVLARSPSKHYKLRAQREWIFPESEVVFPKELGDPVLHVRVEAEMVDDDG
jgi:hypothetical protein